MIFSRQLLKYPYVDLKFSYLTTFLHIDYQVFTRLHFEAFFQYLHPFKVEFPEILSL